MNKESINDDQYKNVTLLINTLTKHNRWTFKWYSSMDMANHAMIAVLIENKVAICTYYQHKGYEIESIDDYIDFAFLFSVQEYSAMREFIKETALDSFDAAINEYDKLFSMFHKHTLGKVITYIANSIKTIAEYENNDENLSYHDLLDTTLQIIKTYKTGFKDYIKQIMIYLLENKPFVVIDNYDIFDKDIQSNDDLWNAMFTGATFEVLLDKRKENVMEILEKLYQKESLKNKLEKPIDRVIKKADEETKNPQGERIYSAFIDVDDYCRFVKKVENKYYHTFLERKKELKPVFEKYIEENGQSYEHTVDLSKPIEFIHNPDIPFINRLLILTHISQEKKLVTLASTLFDAKQGLTDIVARSNIKTDALFNHAVIRQLNALFFNTNRILYVLIQNETLRKSFYEYIRNVIHISLNPYDKRYKEIELDKDVDFLCAHIDRLLLDLNSEVNIETDVYSVVFFCCGFIEKALRLFYLHCHEDKYIKEKGITLGSLLKSNDCIECLLGKDLQNLLIYRLAETEVSEIGNNWRNRVAHWSDVSMDDMSLDLAISAIYDLLSVVNCLFVRMYNEIDDENNGNHSIN